MSHDPARTLARFPVPGAGSDPAAPVRRRLCATAVLATLSLPLTAQQQVETLKVHAYRLQHQPAREALGLVEPLLSLRGTVELQLASNTLVLRDTPSTLERILVEVRAFDHPRRELELRIHILRASLRGRSRSWRETPEAKSQIPPWLEEGLGQLMRIDYETLAEARLRTLEGEEVEYELGEEYAVRFVTGTVLSNRQVKLRSFQVIRKPDRRLAFVNLVLTLDKPFVLGFARDEARGLGLVVAVTGRQLGEAPEGGGGA